MMKKLIFYIVLCFFIFNTSFVLGNEVNVSDINYEVRDFSVENANKTKKESIIKSNNSFATFFILPFLIEKLYPDDEIYEADISSFLSEVYPNSKKERIDYLADIFKAFIISKREYKKLIDKVKLEIKTKKYIPSDAKVVAKDGEFASLQDDLRKKSFGDEYNVANNLYKYAEYGSGELGNPVKRRDKNFEEAPDVEELVVALLEFDIRGIVKAISKMPKFNDGSAEKPYIGKNDLRARILLDSFKLGDKEKVKGVIEVNIPKGFYIKGDFFDKKAHPFFVLKENNDIKHNIKEYNFYLPLANGVEKDGISKRVFVGRTLFPFELTRADLKKDMYFGGDFNFWLCDDNDKCEPYKTEHSIRIKSDVDQSYSIYYNYVTQAHTHLPQTKTKGVILKDIYYDKEKKELNVVINTSRKFSNIAVMVEDDKGTNFLNPRYQIRDDVIVASFDVSNNNQNMEISSVGVSASFDDKHTFRVESKVNTEDEFYFLEEEYSFLWIFLLGIIFNFLPGIFFVFLTVMREISNSSRAIRVCFRYITGLFLSIFSFYCFFDIFNIKNGIVFSCVFALMYITSTLVYCLGYMDFSLFRPFRFIKKGFFAGIFMGGLIAGCPYIVFDFFNIVSEEYYRDYFYKMFFVFCLGLMLPCFLGLFFDYKKVKFRTELKSFNLIYSLIYVFSICWFFLSEFGFVSLVCLILGVSSLCYVWYFYPIYLGQKIKGKVDKNCNISLFRRIQFKFLGIVVLVYCLTIASVVFLKNNDKINNNPKEISKIIETRINNNSEVLVGVVYKWGFKYLIDSIILQKHSDLGLNVIYIDAYKDETNARYWLEKFNKKTLPLYVLYTKRHKNGLVLPDDIGSVNFFKAVKRF